MSNYRRNAGALSCGAVTLLASCLLVACGGSSPGNTAVDSAPPTAEPGDRQPASQRQLIIENTAAPEGSADAAGTLAFVARLSSAAATPVSVSYDTAAGSAIAGEDFQASSGTLRFAAGDTERVIEVPLLGDADDEGNESFTLQLHSPLGAALLNTSVTGTIANDDAACNAPIPGSANPWLAEDRLIINFSHRGGAIDYPENTMYSYKRSVEIGAEVLEMDIYEAADGTLMVIHDDTVDRTTNATGSVSNYTAAELKAMDAAHWYVPNRGAVTDAEESEYVFRGIATGEVEPPAGFTANDFTIPTLEEILQAFPDRLINIELKPDTDSQGRYETALANLLLKYGRRDDVIVASFIDTPATLFKAQAPCISTSYPTGQAAVYVAASQGPSQMPGVSTHQAFQVPPSLGVEIVNQDFVDDAHNAGLAVHVWTINDCDTMVSLLDLGVDAIMTDRPILLQALLAQTEGQWSCDNL